MKSDAVTKDKEPTQPEAPKPFLAIAIRSFKGVVRGARVEGMKNAGFVKTRKVLHLGMFEWRETLTRAEKVAQKSGAPIFPKKHIYEVENLAEFDGPTCEDACEAFLAIFHKSTRSNGKTCLADGKIAPVKLWKKLDAVKAVEVA